MFSLVIVCAGKGSRAKLAYNKLLYKIEEETIIEKTVKAFLPFTEFSEIILVINEDDMQFFKQLAKVDNRIKLVLGGDNRFDSVKNGFMQANNQMIFIHDGARCNISNSLIKKCIDKVNYEEDQAFSCAVPAINSIRLCKNGKFYQTINRDEAYEMQTPQIFSKNILMQIAQANICETDEVGACIQLGIYPKLIEGEYENFKVTTPYDLEKL